MVGDLGLAEDLAQDALLAALERWPRDGVPDNPGAWLMATAKNRAIDLIRRDRTLERKREELVREAGLRIEHQRTAIDLAAEEEVGDDILALIFTCCHPLLAREARVALTLRLLGGLTAAEIARGFLAKEATVAQRLVRAKKALREAGVRFEVPRGAELAARLPSVLEVIYLIFNEGYAASGGEDWVRPALCEEALRLGRVLAELAPEEPEAQGLIALLEIQASRLAARLGPGGEPVLLLDQDRGRWDPLLIVRGRRALARAEALPRPLGPYGLQAAIAA
ncbi:MAG: sigma-70 family RNA polymerase sigma factor, partial [Actinobacteria bacterium]|nr:sigma-70 family RNA polymerase sigma factor [Actinomycetota bacterium]